MKAPDTITDDTVKQYHETLDFIQEQLRQRGTPFLGGFEPGYADYMIWPWFERLVACKDYEKRAAIDPVKYKLLVKLKYLLYNWTLTRQSYSHVTSILSFYTFLVIIF